MGHTTTALTDQDWGDCKASPLVGEQEHRSHEISWTRDISPERRWDPGLKWQHVNPYGTFTLNMNERLPLAPVA
jgi:hypothetical protein